LSGVRTSPLVVVFFVELTFFPCFSPTRGPVGRPPPELCFPAPSVETFPFPVPCFPIQPFSCADGPLELAVASLQVFGLRTFHFFFLFICGLSLLKNARSFFSQDTISTFFSFPFLFFFCRYPLPVLFFVVCPLTFLSLSPLSIKRSPPFPNPSYPPVPLFRLWFQLRRPVTCFGPPASYPYETMGPLPVLQLQRCAVFPPQ